MPREMLGNVLSSARHWATGSQYGLDNVGPPFDHLEQELRSRVGLGPALAPEFGGGLLGLASTSPVAIWATRMALPITSAGRRWPLGPVGIAFASLHLLDDGQVHGDREPVVPVSVRHLQ
jgi:hypothetical protein